MRLKSLVIASLLSASISLLSLISCSTNSNFDAVNSERRYEYAHIQLGEKTCHDNVLSWRTYSDQEVVLNLKKIWRNKNFTSKCSSI